MNDARGLFYAYIAIFIVGFVGCVLPCIWGPAGFLAWLVLVPSAGFVALKIGST